MSTILVVDDSTSMRETLGELLETFGYQVIICGSGDEAVPLINKVESLITDFFMPGGMSGAQLARIAKHEKPGMPVFIVTGTPSLVPDGHLADKVIAKPFKIEVIVKCLRDYGVV